MKEAIGKIETDIAKSVPASKKRDWQISLGLILQEVEKNWPFAVEQFQWQCQPSSCACLTTAATCSSPILVSCSSSTSTFSALARLTSASASFLSKPRRPATLKLIKDKQGSLVRGGRRLVL